MITFEEYFGQWLDHADATSERQANARALLIAVNDLLNEARADGVVIQTNPATGSHISGQTLGGFRPQDCAQGAPTSSHKQGRGVDIYDPGNALDAWLDDDKLAAFGLYREHPSFTVGWTHLTDRAPGSGRRTFNP